MKKMCLRIFYGIMSGFTAVAGLAVCVLKNSVVQKLFSGLIRGQNRVYLGIEKLILGVKRWGIMNVHFAEYPLLKVKKANSLYAIIRKE